MMRKIKIKATQTIHVNLCPLSSGMLGQLLALGEQWGRQGPPVPARLSARWHFRPPGKTYMATNLLHRQSSGCWSSVPSTWAMGTASSSGSAGPPSSHQVPLQRHDVHAGARLQGAGRSCVGWEGSGCSLLLPSILCSTSSCGHPLGRGAFLSGGLMGCCVAPSVSLSVIGSLG